MEVSGKSSLNDSLDYFCQTGGQEVVDIWDLNESLIPLSHGVFQKWRKDQDALPLLHSIPFLISLFIACGKPKVAEVVILQLNTLMYWMEQRKDLMMTMGLNTQMLDDIWIELHNARDTHYFNDKGEATVAAFEKITSLLKLRYMTRDTRAAELGINRKRQEAEVQLLVAKYEKSGWSPTKSKYKSWLLRHVRAAAEKAKGIINGTDPKPAVLRHRLLSKGSEGLLSSFAKKNETSVVGMLLGRHKKLQMQRWPSASRSASARTEIKWQRSYSKQVGRILSTIYSKKSYRKGGCRHLGKIINFKCYQTPTSNQLHD